MLGKLHHLDLSNNRLMELNPEVFKDVQVGKNGGRELKLFPQVTPHSVTYFGTDTVGAHSLFRLFVCSR
jgi:hypothetical protein